MQQAKSKQALEVNTQKEQDERSQMCRVAEKIYSLFKTEGRQTLKDYFQNQLMIPEKEAEVFAQAYNPVKSPVEFCPLKAAAWSSSKIFEELSLQLPGVNVPGGIWPKNILAWWVARSIFGSDVFDFRIKEGATGSPCNNGIDFPAVFCDENGQAVPIGLASIEAAPVENVPAHVARKARVLKSELGKECGLALAKALIEADFIFPPSKEINQLIKVISRGLEGEKVIITGAFCPDYTYEPTGDPEVPYRYTFDSVGSGVGLVAQQFVRTVPHLHAFFKAFGIKHKFIFGIGDFEANSDDVLQRVGLSREEFILRCMLSLGEFRKTLPSNIPIELRMFESGWANGRWHKYIEEAHEKMKKGNFGDIKQNTGKSPMTEVVRFITKASKSFYCAWYGKDFTDHELEQLVISQGAEYCAMGRVLAEDFSKQPFLQIAGDRPKMQAFNSMYSAHPTLCTKRTY